jgi:CDP-4-dehydro-6-deoxyglucose reductase
MRFQVTVQPSGRHFVAETDETILAAAIRQNIPLPYGCRDGACGSCKTLRLGGHTQILNKQATALTEEEASLDYILTCSTCVQSDVVLECHQVGSEESYPVKKMPVRVAKLEQLSTDVMRVLLQLPSHLSFQYHPGQYVDLILRDGARRSYSMASMEPIEHRIEFHIRHLPGGKFTDHVFGALREKEILRIEGPIGGFYLRHTQEDQDKPIILLASGTGFAPIKALLEHIQVKNITRPLHFYWGGKRPQDLYYNTWIENKLQEIPHQFKYIPVVSDALSVDRWEKRTGLVHQAVMDDFPDLSNHQVYACGAPAMIWAAQDDFTQHCQLPADQFFADAFTTEKDKHAQRIVSD